MRLQFAGNLRPVGAWLSFFALITAAVALCLWAQRPSAPPTGELPPDQFSEPRARAVVDHLSQSIGVRLNGTPGHRRAAEFLAAELRKIPGLTVEIQEVGGTQIFSTVRFPPFVYRTLNVVARLPGRSTQAVLLDAHFDTQLDSVGAADDAAGIAAILESLRVLARSAPLTNTLVVNFNGAEEIGLLGAAGFLKHPWAKDVRAYVYVEALPGGMTGMFGAGPGNAWLAKAYAGAVPRPFGSVVGQDLVRAGLLPHNGDFTPFHEAGLAGLDMAMTGDGWAYHTMLDRTGRLLPGSLQHLGESVLAVTRALASAPLPADDRRPGAGAVYYDFLGLTMAAYSMSMARGLAMAALVFAAFVITWMARHKQVSLRSALAALGWTTLAAVAGLLAAVAAGALVSLGLGRPLGWFSAPGLVVPAFGGPAAAGAIAVHALWGWRGRGRLDPSLQLQAALVGAVLFWSVLLAGATAKGVGAGYLPLAWVVGGAAALSVSVFAPRAPRVALLACLVPGVILTLEICLLFLTYFIPITGMMGLGTSDVVVGGLVGLTVASTFVLPLAVTRAAGGFGRVALALTGVGVVGLALLAGRFPYTQTRPKRITVTHLSDGDVGALRIKASDGVAMSALRAALPGSPRPGTDRFAYELPASPPPMPSPRVDIEATAPADGGRRVSLRIHGTSPLMRLAIPKGELLGWSLAPSLATTPPLGDRYIAQLYDVGPAGASVTLTLRGNAPVEIEVRATDGARASAPEVEAVLKHLPPWVTAGAYSVRTIRLKI